METANLTIPPRPPAPAGRLTAEAITWLEEAARAADRLSDERTTIWIGLRPDRFVVRAVRADRIAYREIPFEKAVAMQPNLLLAAVIGAERQLHNRLLVAVGWRGRSQRRFS